MLVQNVSHQYTKHIQQIVPAPSIRKWSEKFCKPARLTISVYNQCQCWYMRSWSEPSLQTRDLHSISILYFTLCCSIWIYQPSNAISISHATLCYSKLLLLLLLRNPQSNFKSSFQAKVTFTFIWSSPTSRSISPALHHRRPGWPHQSRWYLKFSQCI